MDLLPLMPAGKWIAAGILLAFPAISRARPATVTHPLPARVEPVLDLPCVVVAEARLTRPGRAPPAPPPPPKTAAREFVAWLIEMGFTGQRLWTGMRKDCRGATDGLWHLYLWHCDERNVQPVPDNVFGEALATIVERTQVRDRSTGCLRRLTAYVIPDAAPKAEPKRVRRHGGKRAQPATPALKRAA